MNATLIHHDTHDTRPENARAGSRPGTGARWLASDALVLITRGLRHTLRSPDSMITSVALPIMLMLMFVYVFGGAIEGGIEHVAPVAYVDYVVPGVILLTAGFGAAITAINVTNDMSTGVIDRFRSLPIGNWIVVLGHVVASLARNLFATALVVGVALLIGFRPTASVLEWAAAIGAITLFVLMMTWVSVLFGLIAKTPDGASGFTFFVLFLPYVSSAFVPPETMPSVLHGFAEHQPVTPIIETVRGLLTGTPIGNSAWLAIAWCVGILVLVMPISGRLFRRRTTS
ncbi:ABC transporter permease [Actinobacteria bacterium YIM 96077]|uniref:Transport permease protein n=1 Tax=Phytoactinopolyspora halophila TaxID=1981511 RepID=A0A329QYT5_9ACTN|nr:ABC transporter permease [Phytoactinopolyspora halophila]AYY13279.1 ABC transporter permease [Actinobacteria bacterium YIM 96077]RAW17485.1 ABC transporter permease [Phytoactinopolyspora halophila]